ncbi:unnamed protein product, partial [Hapterophycus canaliculatus]
LRPHPERVWERDGTSCDLGWVCGRMEARELKSESPGRWTSVGRYVGTGQCATSCLCAFVRCPLVVTSHVGDHSVVSWIRITAGHAPRMKGFGYFVPSACGRFPRGRRSRQLRVVGYKCLRCKNRSNSSRGCVNPKTCRLIES